MAKINDFNEIIEIDALADKVRKKKQHISNLNVFSSLIKSKVILMFNNLKSSNNLKEFKTSAINFNKLFATLSEKEAYEIKMMCIDIAEFPERYFSYDNDYKYHNTVNIFMKTVMNKYKEYFNRNKNVKIIGRDDYIKIFEDIKEEMNWQKKQYLKMEDILNRRG